MDGVAAKVVSTVTPSRSLRRTTDTAGKLASAVAGDVNKVLICSHAIEQRQKLPGLGQQVGVEILLNLDDHVVDAKRIVARGAIEVRQIGLLVRDALKNFQELRGIAIQRVIEGDAMGFRAALVIKCFLPEVGDPAVHLQVQAIEIVELSGEIENRLDDRRINLQGSRIGLLVELANVECSGAGVGYFDLHEFGITRFEYLAKGDGCARGRSASIAGRRGGRACDNP